MSFLKNNESFAGDSIFCFPMNNVLLWQQILMRVLAKPYSTHKLPITEVAGFILFEKLVVNSHERKKRSVNQARAQPFL